MSSRQERLYGTECIVLSRRNIGEADSILTVFSPDRGRFDAVARGVRKAKSRMRGHLEPLTYSKALLAKGRTLDVFTQAESIEVYRSIHEDLERYAAATYASELVRRFAPEREVMPWLFIAFVELLGLVEQGCRLTVLRSFELALLDGAGVGLQVAACAACGSALPQEECFYAPASGGLLCRTCRVGGEAGRIVSLRAIKVLRYASKVSLTEFSGLRMDGELQGEVEAVLRDAIRFALDDEPRSSVFLREVRSLYNARAAPANERARDVESK